MSGRLPACESPGIAERLAEIQAERIRMIAGCHCPRDALGAAIHNTLCPLRPEPASQMAATLEAMARARARVRRGEMSPNDARRQLGLPAIDRVLS